MKEETLRIRFSPLGLVVGTGRAAALGESSGWGVGIAVAIAMSLAWNFRN